MTNRTALPASSPHTEQGEPSAFRRRAVAILPALAAAALGLVLVYGAGLAQTEALHNAAHDARHAAGFPCH